MKNEKKNTISSVKTKLIFNNMKLIVDFFQFKVHKI